MVRRFGGTIVSHPEEKEHIDEALEGISVGRTVQDGEQLDIGGMTLELIHAPGHTFGSLGGFLRERRALFTGDNVMGVWTSVVNPGQGDIGLFLETMDRFLRYDAQVIYPGQGPVVAYPKAKLEELIAHRQERENQIIEQLSQGPRTVEELLKSIYTDLVEQRHNMARNQVRSHLSKLEREGRVASTGDDTYQLT